MRVCARSSNPRNSAYISVDLNQLIHEVLALVQPTLQKHTIIVRTELDEMLGPVTGNRVQLQQVLFNLVNNAIEAMQSAADRTILIKSELESGGEVHVTVEDSGSGIDPKDIDKIFGSFFTTKIEGMGMGLSICRGRSTSRATSHRNSTGPLRRWAGPSPTISSAGSRRLTTCR